MNSENIVVSDETRKRLVKDVIDIVKHPLTDEGIYYAHSDDNMFIGYAMIIGPKDTPYENGYYLFKFEYPENYPYVPPKLTFMTRDQGHTRFNPNLYVDGKVCLSILNTWKGEKWTPCQTIRSVLLSLVTVLNDYPLTNEPGYCMVPEQMYIINIYNKLIKFKNIEVAVLGMITKQFLPEEFSSFYEIMKKHFIANYEKIMDKITNSLKEQPTCVAYEFQVYKDMYVKIDYESLRRLHATVAPAAPTIN